MALQPRGMRDTTACLTSTSHTPPDLILLAKLDSVNVTTSEPS
jgi:hypothetical protein